MVQIPQKLVVQPLDILVRTNTLLQILILAPPMNRVVNHDSIDFIVLVCLEDRFLDVDTDVGCVPELGAGGTDEA